MNLDHLVYAAPDLAAAVEDVARLTGVRPVPGGSHVGKGTRNHLLGLGGAAFLEVIGPDPGQPDPGGPRLFGIDDLTEPGLVGWAVATDDLDGTIARARAAGYDPGPAQEMSRRRPGGELLRWRLTAPRTGPVPFLIDWGETPHPARELPVVRLLSFDAVHPEPEAARKDVSALGVELKVREGARPSLVARLEGPNGPVTLS
ncbi:VOC family protein [Actinomadura madurae]|uniref:VOC family protein n=1 Tax=Actinomadura madurae TaxID=1993 RepID=UPI0020D2486D|nr:VOC family protein [Actinomadura madurae]MCP9950471.1 VOC family protein [Actinomadura madurae]MCP9979710.1 VOC family protein [Actinomadura madurae]MCQ0008760.1 VOC family protein [Actinomadura madurae]MCQ0015921.1 VOC family protein [Actinomadura madurae]